MMKIIKIVLVYFFLVFTTSVFSQKLLCHSKKYKGFLSESKKNVEIYQHSAIGEKYNEFEIYFPDLNSDTLMLNCNKSEIMLLVKGNEKRLLLKQNSKIDFNDLYFLELASVKKSLFDVKFKIKIHKKEYKVFAHSSILFSIDLTLKRGVKNVTYLQDDQKIDCKCQ